MHNGGEKIDIASIGWLAIILGFVLLVLFPRLRGRYQEGDRSVSGPIGFVLIVLGILTLLMTSAIP